MYKSIFQRLDIYGVSEEGTRMRRRSCGLELGGGVNIVLSCRIVNELVRSAHLQHTVLVAKSVSSPYLAVGPYRFLEP